MTIALVLSSVPPLRWIEIKGACRLEGMEELL